jgi:hypothetical protein
MAKEPDHQTRRFEVRDLPESRDDRLCTCKLERLTQSGDILAGLDFSQSGLTGDSTLLYRLMVIGILSGLLASRDELRHRGQTRS